VNWLYRSGYLTTNPIGLVESPKRQSKILPAISKEQRDTLLAHCHSSREKAILNLLSYSATRLSEVASLKAQDFNWEEGTVIVLGKGIRYRKALAGNGIVREWFSEHNSFDLDASGVQMMLKRVDRISGIHCNSHSFRRGMAVHNVKSGLSTRVVQALGGGATIAMVERYSKSVTFDDALQLYKQVNGSEARG